MLPSAHVPRPFLVPFPVTSPVPFPVTSPVPVPGPFPVRPPSRPLPRSPLLSRLPYLVFAARALAVLGQRHEALVDRADARLKGQQRVEPDAGQCRSAHVVEVVEHSLHEPVFVQGQLGATNSGDRLSQHT